MLLQGIQCRRDVIYHAVLAKQLLPCLIYMAERGCSLIQEHNTSLKSSEDTWLGAWDSLAKSGFKCGMLLHTAQAVFFPIPMKAYCQILILRAIAELPNSDAI